MQLFLIFFGLPSAGLKFDADTAAMVALSINLGAYTIEIVRAGLEAIPKSQIEAGQSLGLSQRPDLPLRHHLPGPAADVSRRSPASSSC